MPRVVSLIAMLITATLAMAPAAKADAGCDRYAGPAGSDRAAGSRAQPFRSAQRLADVLQPGQTGCLLAGTYGREVDGPYVLNIRHGGRRGAPLTIRSAPGQRAKLRGIIFIWKQSGHVTLSDMDIDARRPRPDQSTGVQIVAKHTIIERNDITNHGQAICSVVGSGSGFGRAVGTVFRENTFHDCGGASNQLEHSLYLENTKDVVVTDNLFLRSGTYAVHLYPRAKGTAVTHNVMVGNGGGVIFAGEGRTASSGNVVAQNVIAGSWRKPGILSSWGTRVGTGNVARSNCLSNPALDVYRHYGGFRAEDNVTAAPMFRDADGGDYRLASDSPCLAAVGYDTMAKLQRDDASLGARLAQDSCSALAQRPDGPALPLRACRAAHT